MADRSMSATMLSRIADDLVYPVYLVELAFDSGSMFLADYHRDLTWSGDTYLRTNGLLSFDGLRETGELLINEITIALSGVDTTAAMAKILTDDFLDRSIAIRLAIVDGPGETIVADPLLIFSGRMDSPTITEDPDSGGSTVTVRGTPAWSDFGRKPGRHTNNGEQQFFFTGDLGFEYVSELPKLITWGRN